MKTHPLPYWPPDANLEQLKQVYLTHRATQYRVKPVPYNPESHERLLSLDGQPPYIVDYAVFKPHHGAHQLDWVTHNTNPTRGPTTVLQQLQNIFGEGVKEIDNTLGTGDDRNSQPAATATSNQRTHQRGDT